MFLVTGATGFIGSHLVELLEARRSPYRCLARPSSDTHRLRADTVVRGDLASGEGLAAALEGVNCVLHLAGATKALKSSGYYRGNTQATANLVKALQRHPARLLHVSSLAAAGPSPNGVPLDEAALPAPFTHYGRSKLEAERIALTSPVP